jgi:hypothetical protein
MSSRAAGWPDVLQLDYGNPELQQVAWQALWLSPR